MSIRYSYSYTLSCNIRSASINNFIIFNMTKNLKWLFF